MSLSQKADTLRATMGKIEFMKYVRARIALTTGRERFFWLLTLEVEELSK